MAVWTCKTLCGHKVHECRAVSIESEEPRVKEKPTRSHCKPRRCTENPNPVKTLPEELPSTSLEGGRTQASDKLNKVRNDKFETVQLTWMPHDKESGKEVDEVVRSHEEAAGDEVEGGEVDETSHTTNDGEHQVDMSMDESAATTKRTHPRTQTLMHLAGPAYRSSGEMVKPQLAMLELACTSPTECRPASHEGETA